MWQHRRTTESSRIRRKMGISLRMSSRKRPYRAGALRGARWSLRAPGRVTHAEEPQKTTTTSTNTGRRFLMLRLLESTARGGPHSWKGLFWEGAESQIQEEPCGFGPGRSIPRVGACTSHWENLLLSCAIFAVPIGVPQGPISGILLMKCAPELKLACPLSGRYVC